jgi:hypothetical protein
VNQNCCLLQPDCYRTKFETVTKELIDGVEEDKGEATKMKQPMLKRDKVEEDKVEDATRILILKITIGLQYMYVEFQFNSGSDCLNSASDLQ